MYNSTSINDGLQFINQANTRTNKTSNKFKNNKYKNSSKNGSGLVLEDDIIEGFAIDDSGINTKNANEIVTMNTNLGGYSTSMNNLNTIQSGITTQAKIFLDINKKSDDSSLRNKDIQITDGRFGRVNNAGLLKLYTGGATKCGIPATPKSVGFDLTGKLSAEYSVLQDTAGYQALYGTDMVAGPNGSYPCSDYAGTNLYVSKPIDFNYDTNMAYVGSFLNNSSSPALSQQSDMPLVTVKQCVTRAMDKGLNVAAINNFDSTTKKGSCWIGNSTVMNGGIQNNFKEITHSDTIFASLDGRNSITFAADGGIYAGTGTAPGDSLFQKNLLPIGAVVPVADLSPLYGGTISELTASYAYEKTWANWNDLVRFNASLIGTPGGTLDSKKEYYYWQPNLVLKTSQYSYNGSTYNYNYYEYEWKLVRYDTAVTWDGEGYVYINYKCGRQPMQTTSVKANLGVGYNVDCMALYNKYPSFSLELSDEGIVKIYNNASRPSGPVWTSSNTQINVPLITLSNGRQFDIRAPRPDWVSSGINTGGIPLTTYGGPVSGNSSGVKTLSNGQYISSPTGKCRLLFDGTKLILQYSIFNVLQDKNGDLIGNQLPNGGSNGFSMYALTKSDLPTIKGNVSYIDINNGLHKYPDSMLAFDNTYNEMSGSIPSSSAGNTLPAVTSDLLCQTACNSDANCAGYTYMNGVCKKYTEGEIYPKGDRILFDGAAADGVLNKTYIRNKKIKSNITGGSHYSCNKIVNNVDSSVYSSYPETTEMTTYQKCALGLILDPRMSILDAKNAAAITSGGTIKTAINGIYTNQNTLKTTINTKTTAIETGLANQDAVKRKIDKYEESNNTSTATVTDTELLLVSDNYKYVLWSIVTVLVGIGAIKTFRGASL
jgi:hypothetical protein